MREGALIFKTTFRGLSQRLGHRAHLDLDDARALGLGAGEVDGGGDVLGF